MKNLLLLLLLTGILPVTIDAQQRDTVPPVSNVEEDYSEYDKPTFLRKKPKELPKKSGWTGYNTDEPAYKRQADYNQEREQMKKLAGLK